MFSKEMLGVLEKLKLRLLLSKNLNFISSLLATLDIRDMNDVPEIINDPNCCHTACVDGSEMLINEDWFMKLDMEMQEVILLHEVLHIAKLHPLRGSILKDPVIRNVAFDIIVNRDVISMGYSRFMLTSFGAIVEPRFEQMSEEQIYLTLVKEKEDKQKNNQTFSNLSPCNGGNGDKDQNNSSSLPLNNDLSDMKSDVILLDVKQDHTECTKIIDKVSQAVTLAKSRGWEITAGIEDTINTLLRPKLDWKVILNKYLTDLTPGTIRSWARPNRRYPDVYRPSKDKERGAINKIKVYIDSSCSVSDDELAEYLAEVKHIQNKLKPKILTIAEFDTKIRQEKVYLLRDKITEFKFIGRGGTDYQEVMDSIKKENPQFAIIFTDLFCSIPERPNKITYIFWIRTGHYKNGFSIPDYGTVIHYDNED